MVVKFSGYGTQDASKKMKSDGGKRRELSFEEDLDDEEDSKDW